MDEQAARQGGETGENEQVEIERLTQALVEIESKTQHQHCYGCGSCIAHKALYGHFPSHQCCWGLATLRAAQRPIGPCPNCGERCSQGGSDVC